MKRIFLVGYMGAGKTTIGKLLAKQMGLSFVDLDYYIENRYHKSISELFKEKGEEAFRDIEQKLLREVCEFEEVVISTGGGVPCFYDNMNYMNEKGYTVYLKASPQELADRIEPNKQSRPVLAGRSGEDLLRFIEKTLEKRGIYYEQAALVYHAEKMNTKKEIDIHVGELIALLTK